MFSTLSTAQNSFVATAQSAWDVLYKISDRAWQAVDFAIATATSPDAKRLYTRIGQATLTGCLWVGAIAYVLGCRAYDAGWMFRLWCDALVEQSLVQEIVTPIALLPAAVEPEPELEPESCLVILDRVAPFHRLVKRPNYTGKKAPELRKLCQKAGIKWRDAHGKNKHLSTQEMIQALTA